MFWTFIDIVSTLSYDDIKNHRVYQVFESASCMNRKFILDEGKLIRAAIVGKYSKGVEYDYCDSCYSFRNIHSLFYGSTEMLVNSVDFKSNKDALQKYMKIQDAIQVLENNGLMNELTNHLVKHKRI